jgi:Ser/Thr protein kinase RdoA (MazF antagonist)
VTGRRSDDEDGGVVRGWDGLIAWGSGRILDRRSGTRGRDVRLVELEGRTAIASLGAYSEAELDWELDLRDVLGRSGVNVPRLVPAADGRRRVGTLVVVEEVHGEPPSSPQDWDAVTSALRWLHRTTAEWPQRPGRASSADLVTGAGADDLHLRGLPDEVVEICRAAWGRIAEWPTTVVVGDSHGSNIRMTPAGPVFLDWSAARVDAPEIDLAALPESRSPLEGRRRWLATQALAAWSAARAWPTDTARARRQLDRIDWP